MRARILVLAAAAGLCFAPAARGQIGSHSLPQMPPALAPTWVMNRPALESQEVSAPPLERLKPPPAGADGRPDAVTLDDICKEPREAIRLAESGKFKEAVEMGRPLLSLSREKYRDYTWDYLANAVAWSAVQTGDLKMAAGAHSAAAGRIDDPAVAEYHRLVIAMLDQTKKSPAELKDNAAFQAEVRKGLADRQAALVPLAAAAEKDRLGEPLVRHLRDAYEKLRVLVATDPETAGKEPLAAFRKAAQALTGQVIPPAVAEAQRMHQRLDHVSNHGYHDQGLRQAEWTNYNGDVGLLWVKVQEIKRLCRLHDHLVRQNLADPGDAAKFFQQAHACLFTLSDGNQVWQKIGQMRVINQIVHMDVRPRVPWQETRITPWGIPFSGELASPPGLKPMDPMDDSMQRMDGKPGRMDGQMQRMDGKPQRMDGQPKRMNEPMKPIK
jgi:hypothetical protein